MSGRGEGGRLQRRSGGVDRGSVTAEIALALPALVLLLTVVVGVGRVVTAQIQCVDGARAAARLAARGEPSGRVRTAATTAGPAGAQVHLARDPAGSTVTVVVRTRLVLPVPGGPQVGVEGRASADLEPGA
jgi:Flp pilus assembly protein TadG